MEYFIRLWRRAETAAFPRCIKYLLTLKKKLFLFYSSNFCYTYSIIDCKNDFDITI